MSAISLEIAKSYLDVIHDADDTKLQMLLDGVEDEAAKFIGRRDLGEAEEDGKLPGSVVLGVMLLLEAAYQSSPDDAEKLRKAAEVKLKPSRMKWEL